jgi:hypothetical protein
MTHVGFAGTRKGMNQKQCQDFILLVKRLVGSSADVTLHHGDCVGADAQAHDIACGLGCRIEIHPPSNPWRRAWCEAEVIYPPLPYLERNQAIVDQADMLVATPAQCFEVIRSGTWAAIRRARKKGIPITILYPGVTNGN